ncbi:MAG: M15 family metallopeptidase [Acidimicrobiales bacterium]
MSSARTRARVRRLGGVALVAALGIVAVACMPPIHPDNKPSKLVGLTNGQIPTSQLVAVSSSCSVYYKAGRSLQALLADAKKDGVTLLGRSCYRDYAGQVAARQYWCSLGQCYMAAVPGTSMHGWGKAVDFGEAGRDLDFGTPGYAWLEANAWRYGWNHPGWAAEDQVGAEPWHWEWVGDGGTMYPGTTIGPQT